MKLTASTQDDLMRERILLEGSGQFEHFDTRSDFNVCENTCHCFIRFCVTTFCLAIKIKFKSSLFQLNVNDRIDLFEQSNASFAVAKKCTNKNVNANEKRNNSNCRLRCVAVASEILKWFHDVRAQHWLTDGIFISHEHYMCARAMCVHVFECVGVCDWNTQESYTKC